MCGVENGQLPPHRSQARRPRAPATPHRARRCWRTPQRAGPNLGRGTPQRPAPRSGGSASFGHRRSGLGFARTLVQPAPHATRQPPDRPIVRRPSDRLAAPIRWRSACGRRWRTPRCPAAPSASCRCPSPQAPRGARGSGLRDDAVSLPQRGHLQGSSDDGRSLGLPNFSWKPLGPPACMTLLTYRSAIILAPPPPPPPAWPKFGQVRARFGLANMCLVLPVAALRAPMVVMVFGRRLFTVI